MRIPDSHKKTTTTTGGRRTASRQLLGYDRRRSNPLTTSAVIDRRYNLIAIPVADVITDANAVPVALNRVLCE